jgi:hypothetical protein
MTSLQALRKKEVWNGRLKHPGRCCKINELWGPQETKEHMPFSRRAALLSPM